MIVNTAYMYMGKKGPSINPNIWEGGTVNYPYQVYGYSSFEPDKSRFNVATESSVSFTLPLKKFTKITFGVQKSTGRQTNLNFSLVKNGVSGGGKSFTISDDTHLIVFDIPAEYQDDDVTVRIKAGSRNSVYLLSGVMS